MGLYHRMSSFLDKLQLSDQDERACLLGFLQRVHDGRRQHMVIKDVEYEAWRTFLDGAPREWYVERAPNLADTVSTADLLQAGIPYHLVRRRPHVAVLASASSPGPTPSPSAGAAISQPQSTVPERTITSIQAWFRA